ncbi:MAG: aldo/keto reductase, partial [Oligosphaeraceae bacterium]|nr:aldo/keto reductase [Oligosphaeraceae bacterium]
VSTPREQYDISRDPEVCKRQFDRLLQHLNTDYLDIGMLFFMDTDRDIEEVTANGILDYALGLKQQGVIRLLGASVHNPATAARLVRLGVLDLLMFSINPAFDLMEGAHDIAAILGQEFSRSMQAVDSARADLYRLCESRGVSITVMKALGAGKLLSAQHTPFNQPLTPAQCIHYALSRPAVVSVLVGCQSRAQVLAAAAYPGLPEAEKDYSTVIASVKRDFKGSCVYCGHCQPCPQGIDIAAVNKYLDIARLSEQDIPPGIAAHYRALARHAGDCVSCGHCEKRCPFGTPVIKNMAQAAALFGQ